MEEYKCKDYMRDVWCHALKETKRLYGFENLGKVIWSIISFGGGLLFLLIKGEINIVIDSFWENLAIGLSGIIIFCFLLIINGCFRSSFLIHKELKDKEIKREALIKNIRIREINNGDNVEIELFSFANIRFTGSLYLLGIAEQDRFPPMKFVTCYDNESTFELTQTIAKHICIARIISEKAFYIGESNRKIEITKRENYIAIRLDGEFSNSKEISLRETYWNLKFDRQNQQISLSKKPNSYP